MNKGETGGPQGKFEASTSMKQEWQEPENEDKNKATRVTNVTKGELKSQKSIE